MNDIEKLTDKQRRWIDEVIPDLHNNSYKKQYIKAMTTQSLRAAVNSKCLDCCCWQSAEVRKCPAEYSPAIQVDLNPNKEGTTILIVVPFLGNLKMNLDCLRNDIHN